MTASARTIFHPTAEYAISGAADIIRIVVNPRRLIPTIKDFYSERLAWGALLVFAVIIMYGGGAAMFVYHAIYLGEGGPAISPWLHWLLDSTAAFIGLLPALAIILPLATLGSSSSLPWNRLGSFALVGGVMFAIVTAPGPFLHDALIARGTWIADQVTKWWGDGTPPTEDHSHVTWIVEVTRQIALALPLYIVLMGMALFLVRTIVRLREPRAGDGPA